MSLAARRWMLTVEAPASGRLAAGSSQSLTVRFDATGLEAGLYQAEVKLLSNDPDEGEVVVPVSMRVAGATSAASMSLRPLDVSLAGANPSRARTRFTLSLMERREVEVDVYDARGTRTRALARGMLEPGDHGLEWNGRDDGGRRAASGIYFVRARAGDDTRTLRFVLLQSTDAPGPRPLCSYSRLQV